MNVYSLYNYYYETILIHISALVNTKLTSRLTFMGLDFVAIFHSLFAMNRRY